MSAVKTITRAPVGVVFVWYIQRELNRALGQPAAVES